MTGVQRWRRTSESSPCAVTSWRWCPGYASCATIAGMRVAAVARGAAAPAPRPAATGRAASRRTGRGARRDRSAAARRRRTAPATARKDGVAPPPPAPSGTATRSALGHEARAPGRAPRGRRPAARRAGASFRSSSTTSRQGRALELGRPAPRAARWSPPGGAGRSARARARRPRARARGGAAG